MCSYMPCYLAHSVFLRSMLPDSVLTQGVTRHIVFLHSVLLGTKFVLTQRDIWHTVCYLPHSMSPDMQLDLPDLPSQ